MQGFKFGYKIYRIAHKVDTYRFADAFNLNTGSSKWVCGVWEYPKFEYRVYRTSVLLTVIFFFLGVCSASDWDAAARIRCLRFWQ